MKKRKKKVTRYCIRGCGRKARESVSMCADGNVDRYVCTPCDIALNALVLDFMRIPDRAKKMLHYIAAKS